MAKVLLGVSSSIAIYKACDLTRSLRKNGHEVKVVMTPFSERLIKKLCFETLSGNRVYADWEDDPLAHINLARWCDLFLIAPCSINTLSKISLGIGDNLLTTTALAYNGRFIVAPAANTTMYQNPIVQGHINKLKNLGVIVIEPEEGKLVCEEEGQGKLASEGRILDWVEYSLRPKYLLGKKVLITCGATREYIDSVRFLSNSSSGRMGFSLARVFRWYGASVKVIAGFTTTEEPPEVELIRVVSSEDMHRKVMEMYNWTDVIVMNAAVSDFTPEERSLEKIKKGERLTLNLKRTRDILTDLGKRGKKFLVGFALEEEKHLLKNAWDKLKSKNLDMLIANPVDVMESQIFRGFLLCKDGREEKIEAIHKLQAAELIVKKLLPFLAEAHSQGVSKRS
ncbi:MAG: bifunctional phosphopantothenoylcysteine decarboxylase/phosphopantothenate--cysteine ligase CoaBC [Aquificaceae bacterium]